MRTRKELKALTREQLGNGIFNEKWLYMMLAVLLVTLITGISSIVMFVTFGPLTYALNRIMVSVRKGQDEKADFNKIVTGFTECFGTSVILSLLEALFTFLWSLLLIVPGIIKQYSYSLSMFLLEENPKASWDECHNKSKKLMVGHKWKLFVLDLSFIGWYILGMLCFGIGVIFVAPYHRMARMNFCLDIIEADSNIIDLTNKESE